MSYPREKQKEIKDPCGRMFSLWYDDDPVGLDLGWEIEYGLDSGVDFIVAS